ncbi:MAG: hypothetical protein WB952_05180 [Terriglobales bacterium]
MSRRELVFLVSRAFALFLLTWALVELSYLPEQVLSLSHAVSERSVLATGDYWSRYHWMLAVLTALRMLALFLASILFWRCGPQVEALFSQRGSQETSGQG